MYVNYYTKEKMLDGDNPPIGIILCSDKSDALVKCTITEGYNQILFNKILSQINHYKIFINFINLMIYS